MTSETMSSHPSRQFLCRPLTVFLHSGVLCSMLNMRKRPLEVCLSDSRAYEFQPPISSSTVSPTQALSGFCFLQQSQQSVSRQLILIYFQANVLRLIRRTISAAPPLWSWELSPYPSLELSLEFITELVNINKEM